MYDLTPALSTNRRTWGPQIVICTGKPPLHVEGVGAILSEDTLVGHPIQDFKIPDSKTEKIHHHFVMVLKPPMAP